MGEDVTWGFGRLRNRDLHSFYFLSFCNRYDSGF